MESIIIYIFGIILSIVIWWVASGIIHLGLTHFKIWDKISYRHKKEIDPKYTTKVDPIFKFEDEEWGRGMYVSKWELGYATKDNTQFLISIIPYPIEIQYYQYKKVKSFYACDKSEVVEFATKYTLEEFFDEKIREEDLKRIDKERKETTIENLNKIFKENYE